MRACVRRIHLHTCRVLREICVRALAHVCVQLLCVALSDQKRALTFCTTSGVPKSLPPDRRRPHGWASPRLKRTLISWAIAAAAAAKGSERKKQFYSWFYVDPKLSLFTYHDRIQEHCKLRTVKIVQPTTTFLLYVWWVTLAINNNKKHPLPVILVKESDNQHSKAMHKCRAVRTHTYFLPSNRAINWPSKKKHYALARTMNRLIIVRRSGLRLMGDRSACTRFGIKYVIYIVYKKIMRARSALFAFDALRGPECECGRP